MSFFRKIFAGKKQSGKNSSAGKNETDEAPIQKMKRLLKEEYGMVEGGTKYSKFEKMLQEEGYSDPDEMSEEEQKQIIDKLFPRKVGSLIKLAEACKTDSVFPTSVDAVAPSTPTMDNGQGVRNIPLSGANNQGLGLPGAVGAGSRRVSGAYPSQNGKNAAVEAGGMKMMPDPLMRFPINPRVLKHFQSRIWITYSGCAVISTHEFVNRACAIPAEDAISHGYKVICSSHQHSHDDNHDANEARFLFDVKQEADKMGLNEACVQLNYKKKVFGVGIAIPRVKFREDAKSPSDKTGQTQYSYADEYDPSMIEPKSFKGFAVLDPHWLTYEFDDESANDPVSPFFYIPTWVRTSKHKIHRSWIIRVINSEVPDILKPTYYFGGLSLTQMIYERVWCADKLANEAPLLAMTKRLLIADGNLEQMIGDPRHTNIFFKAINYFRDNFSIFVKKPSSNVTQLDTSLADLTPLTMAQYQLVAAIAQIPVTKLLKNVPSGLQSTGDYEWDDYAQSLKAIQQNDYTPLCRMFYQLYVASNYPDRKDISLDIEWNPIDIPKESEIFQMTSQVSQSVSALLGNSLITVSEARSMLRRTNLPAFQSLTPEVPNLLKKLEEAKDPSNAQMANGMPPPGGAMPGMEQPGQGTEQPQQETADPVVAENDKIFKSVLKKVMLQKEGVQEENTPREEQPTEEPPTEATAEETQPNQQSEE